MGEYPEVIEEVQKKAMCRWVWMSTMALKRHLLGLNQKNVQLNKISLTFLYHNEKKISQFFGRLNALGKEKESFKTKSKCFDTTFSHSPTGDLY